MNKEKLNWEERFDEEFDIENCLLSVFKNIQEKRFPCHGHGCTTSVEKIKSFIKNLLLEHNQELRKKVLHKIYHADSLSDAYQKVKLLLAIDTTYE